MGKSQDLLRRDAGVIGDVLKLRFNPLVADRGKGALLWDMEGKEYLDFSAGWGVASTGYGHPRIVDAVCRQMEKLSFASTLSLINEPSVELAEELTKLLPGDFEKKVWYGHSGSDANEFIAKIVPVATGRPRILTFVGSYHGQTMGSYGMSGHPAQSHFIGGANVVKLPYPYCYRCPFARDEQSCGGEFCTDYIRNYIFGSVCPPEQVGAIVVEAIQCDGGDVVPPDAFLPALRKICDDFGIYLIIDEVKIGFGRTGKMFGYENWGIVPDAVVMGKPMGGGQPLSAVVGRKELLDAGVGLHLFTTAGNPVACASSLETLAVIRDEKLMENASEVGDYLLTGLKELQKDYECIGDVRGKCLVIGVELIKDRETREPAAELAAMVAYRSYELGLLYYYAGIHSNVLELTPPLILTREQAARGLEILRSSLDDVINGKFAPEKLVEYAGWGV